MSMVDKRLAVWPGDGVVQRAGTTVVVVLGNPTATDGRTAGLLDICRGRHGADLVRALAQAALSADAGALPPFAVVSETAQGLMILLRGDIEAVAQTGERTDRMDGRDAVTWIERILPEPVARLSIGAPGTSGGMVESWADLRAGVVAGGGATLIAMAVEGSPAQESAKASPPPPPPPPHVDAPVAPTPEPIGAAPTPPTGSRIFEPPAPVPAEEIPSHPSAPSVDFEAVLLVGDRPVVQREPLSLHTIGENAPLEHALPPAIVAGVRCSRDHHNNPAALYCSSCGIKMGVHRTLVVVDGPRPPLGVLVLDDGATIPVQHDMVIGRDPSVDPLVVGGMARSIRIEDETSSVSRAHLLITIDQWEVLLADRGSANGTAVRSGDGDEWRQLSASERVGISTGTQIRIGERLLLFDQHHVR